ncbi:Hypothetical protein, putative DUF669 family phage protein [Mycoplasmopsis bovigenitalium 51080]|uniref:DUF669 domain-containing protein n=1 Tax=Mycoplasmopsis bovigenitalium 51080 TaxID=1188235 RepID=N9TS69_9BACT|nr:hypothetical protein [Mycoplasmopsis bovigenitalium]ENY69004.1 Hypothetical protein, putative DUF669 family phage protein [Mycoplasmopsis bovigenitalium 51080]
MAINFNKTWLERQLELQSQSVTMSSLPDGTYEAKITEAHTERHHSGNYDVLVISVEISSGVFKGYTNSKTYFIDELYPHTRKRSFDESQFNKLLSDLGLGYNTEREFINALYDLKQKDVVFRIETSEKINPQSGKAYRTKYIDAANKPFVINKEQTTETPTSQTKTPAPKIDHNFELIDDLI